MSRDYRLAEEDVFISSLSRERKRADRSGAPFGLLILNLACFKGNGASRLPKLAGGLSETIRETDLLGWYRQGSHLGVIFTELGEIKPDTPAAILSKVRTSLRDSLPVHLAEEIPLSLHFYPEHELLPRTDTGVDIILYPDLSESPFAKPSPKRTSLKWKRLLDVLGSLALILLLSPLLLAIAGLVKLTSRGPILFRQQRIGQFGYPFSFLKFRSMRSDADESIHKEFIERFIENGRNGQIADADIKQDGIYKLTRDPRVTPLGRFFTEMQSG